MIKVIINIKQNSITSFWKDGSIVWFPLDRYEVRVDKDYSVVEQNGDYGWSSPRIIKGSTLSALLKKILDN